MTQHALSTSVPPITFFNFNNYAIRIIDKNGNPWFVAADICNTLGYKNTSKAVNDHLDEDEKGITTGYTPGGEQKLAIISESGLYALVLRSRKPQARKFAKWVTSEVLPSIRKTGQYQLPKESLEERRRLRHKAAVSYRVMAEMLKYTREGAGKSSAPHHFMNEARLINQVLTGEFKGLDRDKLSIEELDQLAELEIRNSILIGAGKTYQNRKQILALGAKPKLLTSCHSSCLTSS